MAKRDRDTNIWKDKFYRGLPPLYKCFWDFINDDCDNAGVWIVDLPGAKLNIGKRIDPDKAIKLFGPRIQVFDSGNKWHIKTFLSDKLGFVELNPNHKFQRSIIELLSKHKIDKIKGYPDTLQSVKEREGQEKGKEGEGKGGSGGISSSGFQYDYVRGSDESMADVEMWTDSVLTGNDPHFLNMVRGQNINLNGELERLARDHLGLCSRYKWHRNMDTQQAFRHSLIRYAAEQLNNPKVNGKQPIKKFTIDELKQR